MEKKLTNKKRADIYLKAAIFFSEKKDIGIGCTGFCDYVKIYFSEDCSNFPEYKKFKPEYHPYDGYLYWFEHNITGMNSRITALLLAREIALNP